jgi:hypothetical protein
MGLIFYSTTILSIIFNMKQVLLYILLACSFLMVSCGSDPLDVDTSTIEVQPVKIERLEQDLFAFDTNNVDGFTKKMQAKYGKFYPLFISSIINNGGVADSSYSFRLKQFISDRDMKAVYSDCQKTYPDLTFLEQEFQEVFKRHKYHFPEKNNPKVITMMSGFNQSFVYADSTLAIGLEMFLGEKSVFYQMLAMPRYKSQFMNKENILPDATRIWMLNEFPYNMEKSDLLSEMVYMGKIMYLTDAMLPNVYDTLKIQYTEKQLDYCIQNEFNIWSYFAAQKLLYTTDQAEIMKYTAEGPFTAAFSKESAPRIGYWIGWQIVRQYMKNNPEVTLQDLINETDSQLLLSKSKYKPKK